VTDLQIRFNSGRDVLNAYWGYLSDGGLVLPDHGIDVGLTVALEIHIESIHTTYALMGSVVRRDSGGQMVVRFSPGEPHDMLLTDALSETDNVPARRHRRYRIDRPARLSGATCELTARVVDVSDEGCCVQLGAVDVTAAPVGTILEVICDGLTLPGKVVWARHTERGVMFDATTRTAELREYVRRLADGSRRSTDPRELRDA
jgi:hypothetical protein